MMTNQETMKVIAEEVNCEDMCPMIDEIAKQVAKGFELATERVFANDEDEIIFDIMMRLFASGNLMEAVDVLTLTFSIIDSVDAYALCALIANSGRDDVYRQFLLSFAEHSGRCEIKHIDLKISDEIN